MNFVDAVYQATERFPNSEQFGLRSQLQRAAVSIPANIAEGHGRKFTNVFLNHLSIASGSLMEVETLILIAQRRKYIAQDIVDGLLAQTDEIGKMLSGLRKSLK